MNYKIYKRLHKELKAQRAMWTEPDTIFGYYIETRNRMKLKRK